MLTVKVLGTSCETCTQLLEIVNMAIIDIGIKAKVVKVDDRNEFLAYNLGSTPGLVINEQLKSSGRVPTENEVMSWLVNA